MSQNNESDPQTPAVPYAYVGEIRLLPFRHDELPFGWYFCNGERYELSSPQAQVLTGLSENYRADWGLETDECSISLPNLFNENGRGGFLRPVDGAARQVGTVEEDALQDHAHRWGGTSDAACGNTANMFVQGVPPKTGAAVDSWQTSGVDATPAFPNPRIDAETRPLNLGMTPAVYLGV